ncbi:uncharacterized protein LOC122014155 [Zingiber officinale]|uniref:uncharacterized protein LOC122014155 n=1 Tax=Zingiber officinale TaxID=94328 RepID=UPI001C4DB883|nr:uncharacterized protein LOC122014155 [Zingiber officinale]
MKEEFKEVTVNKIPRAENGRADELAKMASSLTTWVLDRSIAQTFLITQIDLQNNQDEIIKWRAPVISYLQQGTLPTDLEQARLVRKKAHAYTLIGDQLYKQAFSRPLLKCISTEEADQVLREMYLECCGSHAGEGCSVAGEHLHVLLETSKSDAYAYLSVKDIYSFLPLRSMGFGIPHKLVSDSGRQFQGRKIQAWCQGFDITQAFTSIAYPQSNGQTEVINREILPQSSCRTKRYRDYEAVSDLNAKLSRMKVGLSALLAVLIFPCFIYFQS